MAKYYLSGEVSSCLQVEFILVREERKDWYWGQSFKTFSKRQPVLCRNTEVITSMRLWVSCPSHPYTALLQIASLRHAAGILWRAKQIRQTCSSHLWGRLQHTSMPVLQCNVIKIPLTAEIHLFQGRDLSLLPTRAMYKDFKSWLSRPERNTFLLIFYDSFLNI